MSQRPSMPEQQLKDPTTFSLLTYGWVVLLAALGGVASFVRKLRAGVVRSWNLAELAGEIVVAGFTGIITFFLCEAAGIDRMMTAALVGISGHMGSRALFMLEKLLEDRAGRMLGGARPEDRAP